MDVRCEKCLTEYDFDDAQVPEAGVTVKCTTCGFVFKVKKRVVAAPAPGRTDEFAPDAAQIDRSREWKIRQPSGNVFTCRELTTLQKWIVERKVAREDEISLSGDQWKRLGDIPELAGFFLVVDQALRGQALEQQLGNDATLHSAATRVRAPQAASGPTQLGARPRPPPDPTFQDVDSDDEDDDLRAIRGRRGPGLWLGALLVLGAAGVGGYLFLNSQRSTPAPLETGTTGAPPVAGNGSGSGSTGGALVAVAAASASSSGSGSSSSSSSGSSSGSSGSSSGSSGSSSGSSGSSGGAAPVGHPAPVAAAPAPSPTPRKHSRGGGGPPRATGVEGLTARGIWLTDHDRADEAIEAFRSALAISPSYADAQYNLAEALKYAGKSAEAMKMYKKFLEDHPDSDDAPAARNALKALSE